MEPEKNNLVLNLVAFAILMGAGANENILSKSPDYIIEKFNKYIAEEFILEDRTEPNYMWGLDSFNNIMLNSYAKKWGLKVEQLSEE